MAYKGFADIGLGSTFTNGESATTFTLTTSHGVQLNPKAFIDVSDYPTTDALIKKIKALDHDEEAYISMLQEQPLQDIAQHSLTTQTKEVERFMLRIVGQPIPQAMRRNRDFWGKRYNQRERELIIKSQKDWRTLLKERMKQRMPFLSK